MNPARLLSTRRFRLGAPWRHLLAVGACAVLTLLLALPAAAQQLPFTAFTRADGLPHYNVHRIFRDSRGFLWFCSRQGLSRFDGRQFLTFDTDNGLPSAVINDVIETPDGGLWIATAAGVARFDPRATPAIAAPIPLDRHVNAPALFVTHRPGTDALSAAVHRLARGTDGTLWAGTRAGLYRLQVEGDRIVSTFVDLGIPDRLEAREVRSLLVDGGTLWVGANERLYRLSAPGRVDVFGLEAGIVAAPDDLLLDPAGRLWLAMRNDGIRQFIFDERRQPQLARVIDETTGLPSRRVTDLLLDGRGTLWAATDHGIARIEHEGEDGRSRVTVLNEAHGLPGRLVQSLADDQQGNLWAGVSMVGLARLSSRDLTTFPLPSPRATVSAILESRGGELVVTAGTNGHWSALKVDGERLTTIEGARVAGAASWGWHQMALEDRSGGWWFGTSNGVFYYRALPSLDRLAATAPDAHLSSADGLAADVVIRLFEDHRGDVWIATVGHAVVPNGLSVWRRQTGRLEHFSDSHGLPRLDQYYPSSFASDIAGHVWIGFSGDAGLVRYREGRFERFTKAHGLPDRQIRNLLLDSSGRLWAASYGGLGRIDHPQTATPQFRLYSRRHGLSSNEVHAIVEDAGDLYIGTAAGIDRLRPADDQITPYDADESLALGEVHGAVRDRDGRIWFAYHNALVRIGAPEARAIALNQALITGVEIGGRPQPVSIIGEPRIGGLRVPWDAGSVRVDFTTAWFGAPNDLRYQYRLNGVDATWSEPTEQRSVNYAALPGGSYTFEVRGIHSDGTPSPPAIVHFAVVLPFWRTPWFAVLATVVIVGAAYAAYRWRTARLLEMANLRTRIATDLHDDIGSNLVRVAVLTEVVRRRAPAAIDEPLAAIAGIARDSVGGMSDIVWAINPERDRVIDVVRKMREHAENTAAEAGIRLDFDANDAAERAVVPMDTRRDLFLIFKEAVTNAARHARCAQLTIRVRTTSRHLTLEVTDDGRGFEAEGARPGNGLTNMRRRASRLGGCLTVTSAPGRGTTVHLELPLTRRAPW